MRDFLTKLHSNYLRAVHGELTDYNSDAKRTSKNFPRAWNKFFEMLYKYKNVRDVHIWGLELRWLKKPS